MLQFAKEYFMVNSVKCFGKVEENSEDRASILLSCIYLGMKKGQGHVGRVLMTKFKLVVVQRVRIYQRIW